MQKRIVILIPCLNEELTIGKVVESFKNKIPKCKIYVYDNNSNDNSVKIASKHGATVVNVKQRGKGNVVRQMFSDDHDGDLFVMIDGDNTYDIQNINKMIDMMISNNLDMVIGKRKPIESSAYRIGHVFGNRFFSNLVRKIFGNQVKDLFSGFRIFSKRFIKTFPVNSSGFEIEAELTIHALEQRIPIAEFECDYSSRPVGSSSKLNTFRDGLKILNLILILAKDQRPLLFFSISGFIFFFLSLLLGIPIVLEFYETGLVERLPSAVLAGFLTIIGVLCFFLGFILDVIKKLRFENKNLNYLIFKD